MAEPESKAQSPSNGGGKSAEAAQSAGEDAVTLLKNDHRKVEQLFEQYEKASRRSERARIAKQVCQELIIHTKLEEEIFYPACREHMDDQLLDEAQVEHDGAKTLINELLSGQPSDEFYDAKVKVLAEYIKHHVGEEEKRTDGIFAKAKAGGVDMAELGAQIAKRKQELMGQADALERPQPRSFTAQPPTQGSMEDSMPQNYRDRDERGRFMSDDDDRGRASSYGRGRSRYDDDDDDRRGRGRMPERDEYGRFMSEDDGRGGRAGARYDDDDRRAMGSRGGGRSRYDDDDGRGHGRGGWFGDPRGHSEASRRGWRDSDHEGSGWYGDPRGHSEASRRGWERSDHEGSGWYGDPEGHSEAARKGWEGRSASSSRGRARYDDDDDRRSYSQSRSRSRRDDDDDDRRGGRSGWFGDSEGHSEAARRGWENRR